MKWFFRIVTFFNLVLVVLTIAGYLGSYISPHRLPLLQIIGLFMPWLLLANVVFFFFWLVLRKKNLWISLLTLALGYFQITRFVGFNFSQKMDSEAITVLSFNSESYNKGDNIKNFLTGLSQIEQIDILCLQEISPNQVTILSEGIGLQHQYFHRGKLIASRYPIIQKGNLQFDHSVNGCLWTDIQLNQSKVVRVYNVHFRSNGVSSDAKGFMNEISEDRTAALSKFTGMLKRYERASITRTSQAQEVTEHILGCAKPIILAGDLNDTPFSYTYQQINKLLIDQFRKKGLGLGTTYAGELPGLKIDYIFAHEKFAPISHRILRTKISDHFPILSQMKLDQ